MGANAPLLRVLGTHFLVGYCLDLVRLAAERGAPGGVAHICASRGLLGDRGGWCRVSTNRRLEDGVRKNFEMTQRKFGGHLTLTLCLTFCIELDITIVKLDALFHL